MIIQYNANNIPTEIVGVTDQFVALDSGRPQKIVMGSKRQPNQEINVTKNVKY